MCESKELLVGYIYDELSAEERQALQAHLAACGACRLELEGLRATRTHLALWSPPVPDLGFRVIQGGSAPAPVLPRRMRLGPAFAFAAAAVIVLAVAAAIANIEVRYGNDGVTVRTGWVSPEVQGGPAETATASAVPGQASGPVTASAPRNDDFAELDRRLRGLEAALVAQPADSGTQLAGSTTTRLSDAEMLRRVRQIVSEAESRQDKAVTQRLLALIGDFDRVRRADLALMQQGLGQYQGLTNANIAQTQDMVNQLVRVANKQDK
ncbi:MAG: zf-HC2 domain-containing protein [Vicinamibacterales bacterium]